MTGTVKTKTKPKTEPTERQKRLTCSRANQAMSTKRQRQREDPNGDLTKNQPIQCWSTLLRTRSEKTNVERPMVCWPVKPEGKTVKLGPKKPGGESLGEAFSPRKQRSVVNWMTDQSRMTCRQERRQGKDYSLGERDRREHCQPEETDPT